MIKAIIHDLSGKELINGLLDNQAAATAWAWARTQDGSFGKTDRWISEDDIAATGEDKTKAISSQSYVSDVDGTTKMKYHFAAEFTIAYLDVSAEIAQAHALSKGLQAQSYGAQIVAAVFALNESSSITPAQLQALMGDPTISMIERLCWNGSLISARVLIAGLSNAFYTDAQKTQVLALVDGYIAELASL